LWPQAILGAGAPGAEMMKTTYRQVRKKGNSRRSGGASPMLHLHSGYLKDEAYSKSLPNKVQKAAIHILTTNEMTFKAL
jgi:hypothetical protein